MTVVVGRTWKFKAGQYVYLWLPAMGIRSCFQSHPYSVAWWDDSPSRKSCTISFLIQPRRGLSGKLIQYRSLGFVGINGPYGTEMGFGDFETVLLFAGGIGIAGILPYVRRLIEGYYRRQVLTRRLSLVWIVERECKCWDIRRSIPPLTFSGHQVWVEEWMNELFVMDKDYVRNLFTFDMILG